MNYNRSEPMPGESFSKLVNLFESIDSIEKGLAKVYDYLLKNGMIEDAKSVEKDLNISLKRIYKIIAVLKDLRLITTYGRPMKVIIKTPVEAWEKIISSKIKQIKLNAKKKIERCEMAYQDVVEAYNLQKESDSSSPVEFININDTENLYNYISNEMNVQKEILVAKGLPFEFDVPNLMDNKSNRHDFKNIIEMPLTILLSGDYIEEVLNKLEKTQLKKGVERIGNLISNENLTNVKFKVIDQPFSNFAVKDKRDLFQYSISPNNKLIGAYISREKEVVGIFMDKFLELFETGESLKEYFKKGYQRDVAKIEQIALILF